VRLRRSPSDDDLRRDLEEQRLRRAAFVAQVAHDVRTPLAAVIGSAQTLRQRGEQLSPEQRDALLAVIASEADRVARFVDELFDAARIDADGFAYSFEDVDVGALVAEAVAAAGAGRDVAIERRLADALPPVRGDRARLRQVLGNLLENAISYAPGSPVEVTAVAEDGDVTIAVVDHGAGVPPAEQEVIFEQFGRGTGAGKPGTGLGLYISRAIAEAHGGTLDVTSTPGEGATFTLRLPQSSVTV
jgi:signal transduction histidine kinase